MEVKMQTSFIPKKPITESHSGGSGVSLFLLLSIIIFIVAVAMAGGIWVWRGSLLAEIEKDKKSLSDEKGKFEEKTINDLIRLDDRINEANNLLAKHLSVTPVFILLQANTIQNVQLKTMKFSYGGADKIKMDLTGISRNYDALSKQSDVFGSPQLKPFISEPVISDFTLNQDGTVSFTFSALIDSELVSYGNTIGDAVDTSSATETIINP
jgi:hypothetical protein